MINKPVSCMQRSLGPGIAMIMIILLTITVIMVTMEMTMILFTNIPCAPRLAKCCQLHYFHCVCLQPSKLDFPGGTVVKNLPADARNMGSIPGLGRSPGGENDNPLQYSCLENSMDSGAWQVTMTGN